MTARTGSWREICGPRNRAWSVWNGQTYALTEGGNVKTFKRRAFAYAYAEQLNREDAARLSETLKELGL